MLLIFSCHKTCCRFPPGSSTEVIVVNSFGSDDTLIKNRLTCDYSPIKRFNIDQTSDGKSSSGDSGTVAVISEIVHELPSRYIVKLIMTPKTASATIAE